MKRFLSILLTLVVVSGAFASDVVRCNAKIYAVDLYPDCAKLYIKGSVDLKKGVNTIEIVDIPRGAYGSTLRVRVAGSGADIHSSLIEYNNNSNLADNQIVQYNSQIETLKKDSELAGLKIKTIDEQITILKGQCSVSNEAVKPTVEYVSSVVDVLGDKMNKLLAARYELNSKIEDNKKAMSKIETKKLEYNKKRGVVYNKISIVVESDADKSVNLGAEFLVSGAGWSPYYEVQINGEKCQVVTKAKVTQNAGLDWNGVQLTLLSSNIGANSATLPVVYSEYIPVADAKREVSYENSSMRMSQKQMSIQDMSEDLVEYDDAPTMAMSNKSYNMENFKLTAPYTIANTGSADIKLTSQSVPMVMEYLIMPTVASETYFVANLITPDIFNRATANIYLDGTFIGTQSLTAYQMAEDNKGVVIKLSLGVDKEIKFTTVANDYTKGNTQSTQRTTKIVNNKSKAVNVKVVERYPISTQSAVKVEDLVMSEGWTGGNSRGIINWVFKLAPNSDATRSISYNVKDNRK